MTINTIAIQSPGDMGHEIGRVLVSGGYKVVSALEGRSKRTRDLAKSGGIIDVGSLENLYDALHTERAATTKALPSFHTGSIVKLIADRRKKDIMHFSVVTGPGKQFHADIKNFKENMLFFVSLYNNKARITIL